MGVALRNSQHSGMGSHMDPIRPYTGQLRMIYRIHSDGMSLDFMRQISRKIANQKHPQPVEAIYCLLA